MGKIKEALIDSMKNYLATTTLIVRANCPRHALDKVLDNMTVQLETLTDDFGVGYSFITSNLSCHPVENNRQRVEFTVQVSIEQSGSPKNLTSALSEVSHAISVQWEVLPDEFRETVFEVSNSFKEVQI